jgi:hypothetical protein
MILSSLDCRSWLVTSNPLISSFCPEWEKATRKLVFDFCKLVYQHTAKLAEIHARILGRYILVSVSEDTNWWWFYGIDGRSGFVPYEQAVPLSAPRGFYRLLRLPFTSCNAINLGVLLRQIAAESSRSLWRPQCTLAFQCIGDMNEWMCTFLVYCTVQSDYMQCLWSLSDHSISKPTAMSFS